ncbi:MAG: DUF6600 domain-containing protein [Verrucomicrobiia bacterium]
MRSFFCGVILGFCFLAQGAMEPYTERGVVDFDQFLEILAPYGEWKKVETIGWIYFPKPNQEESWVPYQQGQWVYTDWGWLWRGEEPFADICYDYGWWQRMGQRWGWIPDVNWDPARVEWRATDQFFGWNQQVETTGKNWFFILKTKLIHSLKKEDFLGDEEVEKILPKTQVSQHIFKIANYRDFVRAGPAPKEITALTGQNIVRHTIMSLPVWNAARPERYEERYLFIYRPKIAQDKDGIQRRIEAWLSGNASKKKRDLDVMSSTIIEQSIQQTVEEVKKKRR